MSPGKKSKTKTDGETRSRTLAYLTISSVGLAAGPVLGLVTVPPTVSSDRVVDFLLAGIGVNASFLVAVGVVFSSVLRKLSESAGRRFAWLFAYDMFVVFLGLVAGAVGILTMNPTGQVAAPGAFQFVGFVLATWVVGFVWLAYGVSVGTEPKGAETTEQPHRSTSRTR